jgi:Ca2+-binding EF-hand superfamily protein
MSYNNWLNLLYDIGCRMKSPDVVQMFRFFDNNQNGFISIEEYTQILVLTDYELDLAMEKIRIKLLLPCIPRDIMKASSGTKPQTLNQKANIGVIGAHSIQLHPYIGKNKIRENITLSYIFSIVNLKKDSILSLDDLMDLSSKLEVFLTEEEARKALLVMDLNGDDRVEEADFISFMRRDSSANMKKAYRLRESVAMLRRWLVRGTTCKLDQSSLTATASKEQWKGFKKIYKKVFNTKFPGYLSPQLLQIALRNLGIFLSTIEARELTLMVAPEKSGRVHLTDLHTFMGRTCRSYGELIALFDREILMDLVDGYRAQYKAKYVSGKEDLDLVTLYNRKLEELKRNIENIYLNANNKPSSTSGKGGALASVPAIASKDADDYDDDDYAARALAPLSNAALSSAEAIQQQRLLRMKSHDIISVAQLRVGLWDYYAKKAVNNASSPETASPKLPESLFPNAEELAALSILFDTDIAEGDIYGVRLRDFLDSLCHHIVVGNNPSAFEKMITDAAKVDIISRELQLQLFREAKAISAQNKAISTKQQQVPDYLSVFQLFDENKNGLISLAEFRSLLKRYQLINALPEHLLTDLINKFDKTKKGNINFSDFRAFAEEVKNFVNDEDARFIAAAIAASAPAPASSTASTSSAAAPAASTSSSAAITELDVEKLSDEDLVDPDDYTAVSDIPPISVANNKDGDWLLWFLYRQACRLDPKEPESVITDLEGLCYQFYMNCRKTRGSSQSSKNGIPIISLKDMWNLLHEAHINGNLVKAQFYTGVEFITNDLNPPGSTITADERVIDYNSLCRHIIRMGRGYLSHIQDRQIALQKKYQTIYPALKTYFKQLCDEV